MANGEIDGDDGQPPAKKAKETGPVAGPSHAEPNMEPANDIPEERPPPKKSRTGVKNKATVCDGVPPRVQTRDVTPRNRQARAQTPPRVSVTYAAPRNTQAWAQTPPRVNVTYAAPRNTKARAQTPPRDNVTYATPRNTQPSDGMSAPVYFPPTPRQLNGVTY